MFYFIVHDWPTHTGSGMGFEFLYTHVPLMDTSQNMWSRDYWNDYTIIQVFSDM